MPKSNMFEPIANHLRSLLLSYSVIFVLPIYTTETCIDGMIYSFHGQQTAIDSLALSKFCIGSHHSKTCLVAIVFATVDEDILVT